MFPQNYASTDRSRTALCSNQESDRAVPLSPLLFVLSIEPLANLIRNHPTYKGVDLPNNTSIRVGMFADDTCFYAKDEESISIIKEMTEIYANGSGGKANIDKTEILPIGDIEGKTYEDNNCRHKGT